MSMILYHGEPNGPSLTVLAALFEKGVQAELIRIDLASAQRHALSTPRNTETDMSIEGEGPVLVVDGEAMADSVFIACYLDDIGTGGNLRPAEPYARWEVMMWCRQIIERLAPAAAFLGCKTHPPRATAVDLERVQSEDLKARWQATMAGAFSDEQESDSRSKVQQAVEKCEARLEGRDWLFGDFSLADLETYAWLAGMVALLPDAFANAPRTCAWLARVRSRDAVVRALSVATVAHPQQVWAPGPEINRWG